MNFTAAFRRTGSRSLASSRTAATSATDSGLSPFRRKKERCRTATTSIWSTSLTASWPTPIKRIRKSRSLSSSIIRSLRPSTAAADSTTGAPKISSTRFKSIRRSSTSPGIRTTRLTTRAARGRAASPRSGRARSATSATAAKGPAGSRCICRKTRATLSSILWKSAATTRLRSCRTTS